MSDKKRTIAPDMPVPVIRQGHLKAADRVRVALHAIGLRPKRVTIELSDYEFKHVLIDAYVAEPVSGGPSVVKHTVSTVHGPVEFVPERMADERDAGLVRLTAQLADAERTRNFCEDQAQRVMLERDRLCAQLNAEINALRLRINALELEIMAKNSEMREVAAELRSPLAEAQHYRVALADRLYAAVRGEQSPQEGRPSGGSTPSEAGKPQPERGEAEGALSTAQTAADAGSLGQGPSLSQQVDRVVTERAQRLRTAGSTPAPVSGPGPRELALKKLVELLAYDTATALAAARIIIEGTGDVHD